MEIAEGVSYPIPEDCPHPMISGSCQSTSSSQLDCNRNALVRENPNICSSNSDNNNGNGVAEEYSYEANSGSIYCSSDGFDSNSLGEETIEDFLNCDSNRIPPVDPILKNNDDSSKNNLFGIFVIPDRDYNISLRVAPHSKTDLIHLLKKEQTYPYVHTINGLKVRGDKPFEVNIYKGNSSWGRDCQRIRHIVLRRDKNHLRDESTSFCLFVSVAENGCMSLDFKWEDTKESIPISFYEVLDYPVSVVHKNVYRKLHDSHCCSCCII